ncbi:MAG TPA: hypothetical protein VJX23_10645 [Candidatus Binataceae bacterium]|nr:hypothetical protein [Candidatus Binataceae bacterium]
MLPESSIRHTHAIHRSRESHFSVSASRTWSLRAGINALIARRVEVLPSQGLGRKLSDKGRSVKLLYALELLV